MGAMSGAVNMAEETLKKRLREKKRLRLGAIYCKTNIKICLIMKQVYIFCWFVIFSQVNEINYQTLHQKAVAKR